MLYRTFLYIKSSAFRFAEACEINVLMKRLQKELFLRENSCSFLIDTGVSLFSVPPSVNYSRQNVSLPWILTFLFAECKSNVSTNVTNMYSWKGYKRSSSFEKIQVISLKIQEFLYSMFLLVLTILDRMSLHLEFSHFLSA